MATVTRIKQFMNNSADYAYRFKEARGGSPEST